MLDEPLSDNERSWSPIALEAEHVVRSPTPSPLFIQRFLLHLREPRVPPINKKNR